MLDKMARVIPRKGGLLYVNREGCGESGRGTVEARRLAKVFLLISLAKHASACQTGRQSTRPHLTTESSNHDSWKQHATLDRPNQAILSFTTKGSGKITVAVVSHCSGV